MQHWTRIANNLLIRLAFHERVVWGHTGVVAGNAIKTARQPFTFPGVARYSLASLWKVLGGAGLFGLMAAAVFGWLGAHCWMPVVSEAIASLPPTGSIDGGTLRWSEKNDRLLAANQFVSIVVRTDTAAAESASSDFEIEFGLTGMGIRTLLGVAQLSYPADRTIPFNKGSLMPAWEAWKMPLVAGGAAAAGAGVILSWFVLAMLYGPAARVIGWVARRELSLGQAWKLAVAAQWPGAVLITFALFLYSIGEISLVFLGAMFVAHFIPSVLYILVSPFFLPRRPATTGANPFTEKKAKVSGRNPFRGAAD